MLVADPSVGGAAYKLAEIFRYGQQQPHLRMRLWLPPDTALPPESPWWPLATPGTLFSHPHPAPALLLLSDAADWRVANRVYGPRRDLPRIHLITGTDLRHWGHGALDQPAVRVALGESVAEGLRGLQRVREPLEVLPIGIDPDALPPAQPVKKGCLVLARDHPVLGLAVQQALAAQGVPCLCELSRWPEERWQRALARAAVVILIGSPDGVPSLGLRRLTAMAMGAALVLDERPFPDGLQRDGQNALVRLPDAAELAQAAVQLLGDAVLRDRLVQGGKALLLRHRSALERLRFQQLLEQIPHHWSAAQQSHATQFS